MGRILVADDQDAIRRWLARELEKGGHEVEEASNGNAAIERLHASAFDLVLTDLKMAGSDGLDVLRTARTLNPSTAVIVMTGFGSVKTAIESIKNGAFDYLEKPFRIDEIEVRIAKALEARRLNRELDDGGHAQDDTCDFDRIIGSSPALQRVLDVVRKVAASNTTVLILGETGSGKELVADAIHYNSRRKSRKIVKVNCAALHENLLESELFGHERGAFTGADRQRMGRFELADGGTLFLDEIGDMAPGTQAKVLRVIQEHAFERLGGTSTLNVDVRLIAASNRSLSTMVQSGHFREDLYYRLNVVSVELPPLRERKDDIVPLANAFIRRFAGALKKKIDGLDAAAQTLLKRHNWPGNIRELANTIERAVLLSEGNTIALADLRLEDVLSMMSATSEPERASAVKIPLSGLALGDIERDALIEALKMTNWVQKDAAELLSISARVISYKIKMLKIEPPGDQRGLATVGRSMRSQPSAPVSAGCRTN
jgi:DNA-binding NtrC family response regulator